MFAFTLWLSMAAFTVLWTVTGGEWWGFGICVLLGTRAVLLVSLLLALCESRARSVARRAYQPDSRDESLAEYVIDFGFLLVFGRLAQRGAHYGLPALMLYVAGILLYEVRAYVLGAKR